MIHHKGQIITTREAFLAFTSSLNLNREIALDVETYKQRPTQPNARLLGIALSGYHNTSGEVSSAYIVIHHYDRNGEFFRIHNTYPALIKTFLETPSLKIVGWNVPFDKAWIDYTFDINSDWLADGRILWHLQNNDYMIRGFGLKLAQKKILGWNDANDEAMEEHVRMFGGKLSNGDHYLADLDVMAHYACLDTYSTLKCYERLKEFMVKNEYQWFGKEILNYAITLSKAANQGLPVSVSELMHAAVLYKQKREHASQQIREICRNEIDAIEDSWKVTRLANYKTARGRERFLSAYDKWQRFNPSSSKQRALLIHTMLEFPVLEKTPTGLAKTDKANLAAVGHEASKTLINYSEYKKIAEAAETYLKYIDNDRLYTNYDVCGTVSGRLSGFKPSVLNMPFSEQDVMGAFKIDEGYVGIHADLTAIEPCVLAHYTSDPALVKVYKEGKGDIYLDLALDIFPDREDLKRDYDPNTKPSKEVKEKYADLRAVCKIIHLAVSYTGTHVTIAKNLSKAGYLTTKGKAMDLVSRYWRKFSRVKAFNSRVQEIYQDKGQVRNLVGRIIKVPDIYLKDTMNRLVQSSAHDILRLWVMKIIELFNERQVDWKYSLIDIHDSTTFMIKIGQEEIARQCYLDALKLIEEQVQMNVPIKCELKFIRTLAGLKGDE